jgi:hypothetical protein
MSWSTRARVLPMSNPPLAFSGSIFGGGAVHDGALDHAKKFVAPNLRPDPRWGWLQGWDEEAFVARCHAGRVHAESPMP